MGRTSGLLFGMEDVDRTADAVPTHTPAVLVGGQSVALSGSQRK